MIDSVREKLLTLLGKFVAGEGFELVDISVSGNARKPRIQLFVDREGGISIRDCVYLSKNLNPILDAEDVISGPYVFEVSSPGLERVLNKVEHFERFKGSWVKLTSTEQGFLSGKIGSVSEGDVITIVQKKQTVEVPFEEITKANLWYRD